MLFEMGAFLFCEFLSGRLWPRGANGICFSVAVSSLPILRVGRKGDRLGNIGHV